MEVECAYPGVPNYNPDQDENGDFKTTLNRALELLTRYLAVRDHSVFELRQKLLRRHETQVVEHAIAVANDRGWLVRPEEIAQRAVQSWQRRNKSQRYIEEQLRRRHLPLLPLDQVQELTGARALVEKKFGDTKGLTVAERASALRLLRQRGFNEVLIGKVFRGED